MERLRARKIGEKEEKALSRALFVSQSDFKKKRK
jgi:hypothetical protein